MRTTLINALFIVVCCDSWGVLTYLRVLSHWYVNQTMVYRQNQRQTSMYRLIWGQVPFLRMLMADHASAFVASNHILDIIYYDFWMVDNHFHNSTSSRWGNVNDTRQTSWAACEMAAQLWVIYVINAIERRVFTIPSLLPMCISDCQEPSCPFHRPCNQFLCISSSK